MNPLHALRDTYRRDKAALVAALLTPATNKRNIRASLHQLSALADRLLCRLWDQAELPAEAALLAVGGYGRA